MSNSAPDPTQRSGGAAHRALLTEVQALRALAVVLVVLYHLWPNRLTGGFIGVDVFFVISGFLIGSALLREAKASGRIRLLEFWVRRGKRLLPAALIVLLVITVATVVVMPRGEWPQVLGEVIASTFYVENWYLAWSSVDYLASENTPSPVQHFWTLSVEEQFYIALPLVLTAVLLVAGRDRVRFTRLVWPVLGALLLASLTYSVVATQWTSASAYFSTFTRGWEFLAGVMVAALPRIASSRFRGFVAGVGALAVLVAAMILDEGSPIPGYHVALPVLGAVAVIWAGSTFLSTVGALAPVAFLARVSYAVYLWHWPLIVLAPYVTGVPLRTSDKIVIVVASVLLGWLSTRFVEEPMRFSKRALGGRRLRTVAVVSLVGMVTVSVIALGAMVTGARISESIDQRNAEIVATAPDCLGAAIMQDPSCANPDLDGVLVPDPAAVADDDGNRAECWSQFGDGTLRLCALGDPDANTRVLAIGDSHNNSLIGAYDEVASDLGWRIDVAGRAGCYWTEAQLPAPTTAIEQECADWRASATQAVQEGGYDAVVVTKARIQRGGSGGAPLSDEQVVEGLAAAWDSRRDRSVPVIAIVDNPALPPSTSSCVEEFGLAAAEACAVPAAEALPLDAQREAAARVDNAHIIDLTHLFCGETCSPVIGNVVVYRDGRHLTGSYAKTLVPALSEELRRLVP